jgi:WD40 repeat protein
VDRQKLFISYSRKDIQSVERIHLELENAGFDVWRDTTDIEPAMNWSREAAYHIATSDIFILLWSRSAACSPIVKHEWLTARALEKGIIPCFLEPLNDLPIEARLPQPLENINGIDFSDFEKGIKVLIQKLKNPLSIDTRYDYTQLPPHSFIPFRPNPNFVGRQRDLLELYLSVIGGLNVIGINQTVSLFGLGGIGKTQLAVEFAYRFAFAFSEGIWWLNAARDWRSEFISLAHKLRLSADDPLNRDSDRVLLHRLQGFFSEHKSGLLLMDNVADPSNLDNEVSEGFVPTALGCTLLFTSKSQRLPMGARPLEVKVLDDVTSFQLLTRDNPPTSREEEGYAKEICRILGYLPLALELAGTYLKKRKGIVTYQTYIQNIQQRRLQILEQIKQGIRLATHDPSLLATFESQYQLVVNKDAQHLFKLAGQFPEAEMIPTARLGLLAGIIDHPESLRTPLHDAFNELIEASLVEKLQDNRIRMHPIVWEFAKGITLGEERTKLLTDAVACLHSTYDDPIRLGQEYVNRGIDSVIDDVKVGINWSDSRASCWGDLTELQRLFEHQCHNLRIEAISKVGGTQTQAHLFQQLHFGAYNLGMTRVAQKFLEALKANEATFFRAYGEPVFIDSAQVRIFTGHLSPIRAVSMSSDGKQVISGSTDKTLILWDVESGQPIRIFKGHSDSVWAVSLSGDGKRAISGSKDKTLILWDVESGQPIRTFKGHSNEVRAVCMSSDGRRAISGSTDGKLILWDVESGKLIRSFTKEHSGVIRAVSMSYDGKRVVSGSDDRTLSLWDVESGQPIRTFKGHLGPVRTISLSGDGKRAISGSSDSTLILWDVESGKPIRTFVGTSAAILAVSLTIDGKRAISASANNLILWDVESGKNIRTFAEQYGVIKAVRLSSDGKLAIIITAERTLVMLNLESGEQVQQFKIPSYNINTISFSNDGKRVITASGNKLILWDVESGKSIHTFVGHSGSICAVSLYNDDKYAISASDDNILFIWDVDSGKPIRTIKGHSSITKIIRPGRNGRHALSVSVGKTIVLWNLESGEVIRCLYVDGSITSLSWLGDKVIFGDGIGRVRFMQVLG